MRTQKITEIFLVSVGTEILATEYEEPNTQEAAGKILE